MKTSRHFKTRCIQRFISENDINMTRHFGIRYGCKATLSEKSCQALIQGIDHWIAEIELAKKSGNLKIRNIDA